MVNDLVHAYAIDHIDLLKVDIEGGEVDLFTRPEFLSKVGLVAIELHGDYTIDKFQDAIDPAGFHAHAGNTYPG
jgi:hypothetical protein